MSVRDGRHGPPPTFIKVSSVSSTSEFLLPCRSHPLQMSLLRLTTELTASRTFRPSPGLLLHSGVPWGRVPPVSPSSSTAIPSPFPLSGPDLTHTSGSVPDRDVCLRSLPKTPKLPPLPGTDGVFTTPATPVLNESLTPHLLLLFLKWIYIWRRLCCVGVDRRSYLPDAVLR